jgi:hypothetical protein
MLRLSIHTLAQKSSALLRNGNSASLITAMASPCHGKICIKSYLMAGKAQL